MIGDDEADIEGARRVGFVPVRLDSGATAATILDFGTLGGVVDAFG